MVPFKSSTNWIINFVATSSPTLRTFLRPQSVALGNDSPLVILLVHFHIQDLYRRCIVFQEVVQVGVARHFDTNTPMI